MTIAGTIRSSGTMAGMAVLLAKQVEVVDIAPYLVQALDFVWLGDDFPFFGSGSGYDERHLP
jgi:hypothetical protein